MHLAEPCFSSPCPALERNSRILVLRLTKLGSQIGAPHETLVADRLAEITNDSIAQGAGSLAIVGATSNEDCGNGVPHIDKVSVELNAGHRGHMDVDDQACGFGKTRGSEEIGCRYEILGGIAQRRHEPRRGGAKELVIVNDRNE